MTLNPGRALRHPNFRLFVFGQSISLIGNWMTKLATTWLVYRLTDSALLLGVVSFAGSIITFLLAPVAGAWIESIDRRKLLIWTQSGAAVQSLALAALTLSNQINLYEIIALTALQGTINAFDMPGRQSFLAQMIDDKEDLGNAIAINSSIANGARLIGPAIAGLVIAAVGEGWCFFIDGVSYVAVIASLGLMRIKASPPPHAASMIEKLHEGWRYVSTSESIRTILTLFAIVSLMGYPFNVLMPIFAAKIFHGGAMTLGWLTAAAGLGAFFSALSLAARKSVSGLPKSLQIASAVFGITLVLFGFSTILPLSLLLMVVTGFAMIQCLAGCNTLIQTFVSEDKRARVMSYYTMTFFGAMPFGSLLSGLLAHEIGATHTIMLTGACIIAGSLWYTRELPKVHITQPVPAVLIPEGDANAGYPVG